MSTRDVERPAGQEEAAAADGASGAKSTTDRRVVVVVVVVALLVVAGFAAGWLLRGGGGGEASPPSYLVGGAVVAGDQLTDRQREMVDLTEQYVAAFIAQDGDAVAALMVPDGTLVLATLGDRVVRASDGSLQDWVEQTGLIPNELADPVAVYENQVVLTGRLGDSLAWMMLLEFTDSGEVRVVSDTHWAF